MRKRWFIALAATAFVAASPALAVADQAASVPRVAFLAPQDILAANVRAFQQGLADYGYVDGKNIVIEWFLWPTPASASDVIPAFAAKAVASNPDIIMTQSTAGSLALKNSTAAIPIVFAGAGEVLATGVVASLSHPGGNITGLTSTAPDLAGKQLTIMKEIVPTMTRIAILNQPDNPAIALNAVAVSTVAVALGIEPVIVNFDEGQNLAPQFSGVVAARVQAVFVPLATYFNNTNKDLLCDLAIKNNLATIFGTINGTVCGVVAYAPTPGVQFRQAASYVNAILKGAKPGELPVDEPTAFDFVVNRATAKALGIAVPPSILAQATDIIE